VITFNLLPYNSATLLVTELSFNRTYAFSYAPISRFFAPVTLTLIWRPWYMKMTYIFRICTRITKMKLLHVGRLSKIRARRVQTDTHTQTRANALRRPHSQLVKWNEYLDNAEHEQLS